MSFALIIPTYNPGKSWAGSIKAIKSQSLIPDEVLIIDSSSIDSAVAEAVNAGFKVEVIDTASFNHGGTRKMAVSLCSGYDLVVFMTQDAILYDENALQYIVEPFSDNKVAAVCGRQLPRQGATSIEAHARLYNYSTESFSRSFDDRYEFGLKTAFISNSFAAYRISALNEVSGFPDNVIFGEDMYVAAKLLRCGYRIAYAADARVYHSHHYSLLQEMKRYFDMGVFHARAPWVRQELGGAEGEGVKFVISELKYLLKHAFWRVPEVLVRTLLRYSGFRLGLIEKYLPMRLKNLLAMNKRYFKR
jgi:rhamnosyltransferase